MESHSSWPGLGLGLAWLKKASACGVVVLDTSFWEWIGPVERFFSFTRDGRVSGSGAFKGFEETIAIRRRMAEGRRGWLLVSVAL
jgi:hypothetical protein